MGVGQPFRPTVVSLERFSVILDQFFVPRSLCVLIVSLLHAERLFSWVAVNKGDGGTARAEEEKY